MTGWLNGESMPEDADTPRDLCENFHPVLNLTALPLVSVSSSSAIFHPPSTDLVVMFAGPLSSDQKNKNSGGLAYIRTLWQLRARNLALSPSLYPNLVLLFCAQCFELSSGRVLTHDTLAPTCQSRPLIYPDFVTCFLPFYSYRKRF